MYNDQSTCSISFYVIFAQFFFFRPAIMLSSGSSQVRLTLLWPTARLMFCFT